MVSNIFEYDPTFHAEYQKCCKEIQNIGNLLNRRLSIELTELLVHPGVRLEAFTRVSRRVTIIYGDKQYIMTLPPMYPFRPPIVKVDGRKVRPFDYVWSPATTLVHTVLVCDVEAREGKEMC
jgi:hypothetical protein